MSALINVVFHGEAVGTMRYSEARGKSACSFTYADSWREKGFPLLPSMPLSQDSYFSSASKANESAFLPIVSDSMPDSWGRKVIRKTFSDGTPSSLDFLTSVPDLLRQGALQYQVDGVLKGDTVIENMQFTIGDLASAARAIERNSEGAFDRALMRFYGSASGGARPKASIIDGDDLYIAKFTGLNEAKQTEAAEVMTLKLARLCGLNVPDARCMHVNKFGDIALIKRFDRDQGRRVHYASGYSFLGVTESDEFSYVDMADAMMAHCIQPNLNAQELFRRVAFTCLVSNTDDHLRNHGFLYDGGWQLSPAFDINPDADRGDTVHLKTPICPDGDYTASIEKLVDFADFFMVNDPKEIVGHMAQVINENWRTLAQQCGIREVAKYRPAFEHRDAMFAHKLNQTCVALRKPTKNDFDL